MNEHSRQRSDMPSGPAGHSLEAEPGSISRPARLALLVLLWTLPALIIATQRHLFALSRDYPTDFWNQLLFTLPDWYAWGLASPVIFSLQRRFPLGRGDLRRSIPALLLGNLVISMARMVVTAGVVWLDGGFEKGPRDFPGIYFTMLAKNAPNELLMFWAILGAATAIDASRQLRERERRAALLETQLAQAQLRALRMQLNPHFLFNTLHAIAGLVRTHDNKGAVKMIAGLSDLLRYTLENVGAQTVPLRQELDFLERYLAIEQIRFRDRLRVEMRVDPGVLEVLVPNLILQPLVENAIRHGIAPRASGGTIEIRAASVGDRLRLEVRDDGGGLTREAEGSRAIVRQPDERESTDERGSITGDVRNGTETGDGAASCGVGLRNTRARLEALYGARQTFSIQDLEGGGVAATLSIPLELPAPETRREAV